MATNRISTLVNGTAKQSGNLTGRCVRMAWTTSVLSHPQHPVTVERPRVVDAISASALRAGRLDDRNGSLRRGQAASFAGYPVQFLAKRQKPCRMPKTTAVLARA